MMRARMPLPMLLVFLIPLLFAQAACNIPGTEDAAAPPVITQPMPTSITSAPPATAGQPSAELPALAAPIPVDLCTVLTIEEIEAALGGTLAAPPAPQSGSCAYTVMAEGNVPLTLSLSAGYGDEGKEILGAGAMTLLMFGGMPDAQQQYETLQANAASMSVAEFTAAVLPMYAGIGYVQTDIPDVEDAAHWLWNEQFKIGVQFVVRGETFVSVSLIGMEEAIAREKALPLALAALDRLPAAFDVLPDDTISVDVTIEVDLSAGPASDTSTANMPAAVWVTEVTQGSILRIDPESKEVVGTIDVGVYTSDVAAGGGYVWALSLPENQVMRIDPADNSVTAIATVPGRIWRIAYGHGALWVAGEQGVYHVDPDTGEVTAVMPNPAQAVAVSDAAVWATLPAENRVVRLDPATGQVMMTIGVEGEPTEIDEGRGAIWVLQSELHTIARIDPATDAVTPSVIPENVWMKDLDASTGGLWTPGILFDSDDFSGKGDFHPGERVEGLAVGLGGMWIACGTEGVIRFVDWLNYEIAAEINTGGQVERVAISGE